MTALLRYDAACRAKPQDETMLFFRQERSVAFVEAWAKQIMGGFDRLPPEVRFALNCAPESPTSAAKLIARYGPTRAAEIIFRDNDRYVFKIGGRIHP